MCDLIPSSSNTLGIRLVSDNFFVNSSSFSSSLGLFLNKGISFPGHFSTAAHATLLLLVMTIKNTFYSRCLAIIIALCNLIINVYVAIYYMYINMYICVCTRGGLLCFSIYFMYLIICVLNTFHAPAIYPTHIDSGQYMQISK